LLYIERQVCGASARRLTGLRLFRSFPPRAQIAIEESAPLGPGTARQGTAVILMHGASGLSYRGVYYAAALNRAGIATLEIARKTQPVIDRRGQCPA
jgi:hypothetical protein